MRYKTIREATVAWAEGFNAIQQGMIERLMTTDPDGWEEVTIPAYGDRVYVFDANEEGEITAVHSSPDDTTLYEIKLDGGETVKRTREEFEVERYETLPMWGTMWSFGNGCDDWWLSEGDGLKALSECGFRVYLSDEFGYFFGIDGAGYSFFEAHWEPLYKARGLRWHEEEGAKDD